jgi:hypothetical protein
VNYEAPAADLTCSSFFLPVSAGMDSPKKLGAPFARFQTLSSAMQALAAIHVARGCGHVWHVLLPAARSRCHYHHRRCQSLLPPVPLQWHDGRWWALVGRPFGRHSCLLQRQNAASPAPQNAVGVVAGSPHLALCGCRSDVAPQQPHRPLDKQPASIYCAMLS